MTISSIRRAIFPIHANANKKTCVSDGVLTARVIGEFSSGKTRFLRELLGTHIPEPLKPISSLERQTRLPLEITYAPKPALSLIEKNHDGMIGDKARLIETLSRFPDRESVLVHDPSTHRLRLEIPEERLILENGDGYGTESKRLFLVDMPGWNSGDDQVAEEDPGNTMAGFHNLALIYVVSAVRMDGQNNAKRLDSFLEAFYHAIFFGESNLIIILTHCAKNEEEKLSKIIKERVQKAWSKLGNAHDLSMSVFTIDFQHATPAELNNFRETFWKSLLHPLSTQKAVATEEHPWAKKIRSNPESWEIKEAIQATRDSLNTAQKIFSKISGDKHYLPGMNATKLMGLEQSEVRQRLMNHWLRHMKGIWNSEQKTLEITLPELPAGHAMAEWWRDYWIPQLQATLRPTTAFLRSMETTLNEVPADIPDLQAFLCGRLDADRLRAEQALKGSFPCLVDTIAALPSEEHPLDRRLATLLQLSVLQSRYQDHLRFS